MKLIKCSSEFVQAKEGVRSSITVVCIDSIPEGILFVSGDDE